MSSNDQRRGPRINPPATIKHDSVDYLRECAFAVEPSLVSLIETAAMAGWGKKQIVLAIMIAAGDYFQDEGLTFELEDIHYIGPRPSDLLN